jgi:hypothetical protein
VYHVDLIGFHGTKVTIHASDARLITDIELGSSSRYEIVAATGAAGVVDRFILVLKIDGIFTHAQMDQRMWDSIIPMLSHVSPQFQER